MIGLKQATPFFYYFLSKRNLMITGELKNKVDALWTEFWTGGLANPLDVIEQITYLMFIHDLDEVDTRKKKECVILGTHHKSLFPETVKLGEREVKGNDLRWSVFRDKPASVAYETVQMDVFPFIKTLHSDKNSAYSKYMGDAIFKIPTPQKLSQIIDKLEDVYELLKKEPDKDARGDLYEYLLSKIATSGTNGQFRTPRHIIRMMVELLAPVPEDHICDPACGTSGFLVEAAHYLKTEHNDAIFYNKERKAHFNNTMFTGYDMDRTMLRIGAMNMMTHGIENPNIAYRDSLSDQNGDSDKYDKILANPPFKGSLDYDIVSANILKVCKTKKTELLFLALFLRMLKVGGRCASIVPDGVLFGSSTAHKALRKELIEKNRLEAIISMPSSHMPGFPLPLSYSPKRDTAEPIRYGSTICSLMATALTTNGLHSRRMIFPTSSSGSTALKLKTPEQGLSRAFSSPSRKSWIMAMICPSTSTSRRSIQRKNIPLLLRS